MDLENWQKKDELLIYLKGFAIIDTLYITWR